jgi:putative FmdB family regulatory protein
MPIYEYECTRCRCQFEHLALPGAAAPPVCPECQGTELERLSSGFAVNSAALSSARVESARKAIARSRDKKDKQVAQAEYEQKHRDH